MKKLLFSAFLLLGLVLPCASQLPPVMRSAWTTNAPAARNASGSNITFYPLAYNVNAFEVYGNTGVPALTVRSNGYTGFNNATPLYLIDADGRVKTGPHLIWDTMPEIYFQDTTPAAEKYNIVVETNYFKIRNDSDNQTRVAISDVGYVGINTNTPQGSLHVRGTTWMEPAAYNQNILQAFDNAGTAALTVLSNGYVGVGTNNPTKLLTVAGGGTSPRVLLDGYGTTATPGVELRHSLNDIYRALIRSEYDSGNPNLTFWTSYGGVTGQRITILGSGFVGIGTNTPAYDLSLKKVVANADVSLEIGNDAQSWLMQTYGTANDAWRLFDATANKAAIVVSTNHEHMIVVTNGRVGIGTLGPVYTLDVTGDFRSTLATILSANPRLWLYDSTVSADTWQIRVDTNTFSITNPGDSRNDLSIDGNGEVTISTNLTAMTNVYVGGTAFVTNEVFSRSQSNALVAADFLQPVRAFAQLAFDDTNTIDMAYETYTNVVNGGAFDNILTNLFTGSATTGILTNVHAGFYKLEYGLSVVGSAGLNGDEVETEVFINGAGDEHTAQLQTIGSSGFFAMNKSHTVYLAAGSWVELKIKNVSDVAQDIGITRATLIVGSP